MCDVFENDLGDVHLRDSAEIRLNAYADRVFRGKVVDISRVLDPEHAFGESTDRTGESGRRAASRHVCRRQVPVAEDD